MSNVLIPETDGGWLCAPFTLRSGHGADEHPEVSVRFERLPQKGTVLSEVLQRPADGATRLVDPRSQFCVTAVEMTKLMGKHGLQL